LKTIIEKMIKHGLLEIEMVSEYKNLPTLIITQKGQNFLANKISENIKFVGELSDRDVILLNNEEQRLYDALRELRRDTAKKEELPAYIICGNISLREMAKFKPETEAELLSITNIGEKFIQKYGYDFLEVIKSFVN
jgi:ATP-dependent DNA helicase RecQ